MSFPRYQQYKDSGVEWLGEVPTHWKILPLKRDLAFLTSGSRGWADHYSDDGALFIRIGNLTRDRVRLDLSDIQRVCVPAGIEGERTRVQPGDVLFSITAYLGSVATVPADLEPAYVSQHIALARIRKQFFLPEWVAYVALSYVGKTYLETQGYGGTKIQLGLDDIANLIMTVPEKSEQSSIIAFLDHETAKIDALVGEQQRLIELLKEKRQAVISHTVTNGLNPSVPMKDSGIEWLGWIPEHWTRPTLNSRYYIELGKMLDESRITGQHLVPYLRNVDVQWGSVNFEELPEMDIADAEYRRYTVETGDLLVCEGGEVGRAAIVTEKPGVVGFQKALHRLRQRDNSELTRFLYYTFAWAAATGVFSSGGSSTIAHLTGEQMRKYRFPKPPLSEQVAISRVIDREVSSVDKLTAEANTAIALLQERRTALISAAVTGKIDVRGLVIEKGAAA